MKKIVLGALLTALAGSTAALAQGGAATGAATGAVGALSLVARPEQPLAQPSARSPAELLTIRVRDFART